MSGSDSSDSILENPSIIISVSDSSDSILYDANVFPRETIVRPIRIESSDEEPRERFDLHSDSDDNEDH